MKKIYLLDIKVGDIGINIATFEKGFHLQLKEEYQTGTKYANIIWRILLLKANKQKYLINLNTKEAKFWFPVRKYPPFHKAVTCFIANLVFGEKLILLHASSVMVNGKIFVFMGPEGIGKSTIANISNKHKLSDDVTTIINNKNVFQVYPSIFEKKSNISDNIVNAKLAKIFLLHHSKINRIEKMGTLEAICKIGRAHV